MKSKQASLRPVLFVLLASALAAVFPSAAAGQETYRSFWQELEEARSDKTFRLGPVRFFPVFRISDVGYDSNVYYREGTAEVVSDYTAVLSPSLKTVLPVGSSAILSFTENPEYNFFAREKDLRSFTNSWASSLRLRLPLGLVLSGTYLDERHVRRSYSEFEHRMQDVMRGIKADAFVETRRGSALGVSLERREFSYRSLGDDASDAQYAANLDRTEDSGFVELDYRVFSRSFLFVRGGLTDYSFDHLQSAWRNAGSVEVYGGIKLPLTGSLKGGLSLGWKKFTPDSEERRGFSGLIGEGSVDYRAGKFAFSLGYVRDNFFSYIDKAYYYVENRFKGGVSFYLFPFLRLDYTLNRSRMSYPEAYEFIYGGETVYVPSRRDTIGNSQVGLVVRISGDIGLGVNMNFYRRESNAPGYDIDRDFIGAYLTYAF